MAIWKRDTRFHVATHGTEAKKKPLWPKQQLPHWHSGSFWIKPVFLKWIRPQEKDGVICKHNDSAGSFAEGLIPWQEPKRLAHFSPHVSVFYTPIKCADTINRAPVSFCRIISQTANSCSAVT